MFGELKQRSVLWDEPRAAAERVGVNYFMALFCRNYFSQYVYLRVLATIICL